MKAKFTFLSCVGLLVCSFAALAQDNPPTTTTAPPATTATTTPPATTAPETGGAAASAPGAVVPLIQYVDVPLTTAIENLARQAGLNYILDPKVGYGQLGADGKPVPQPTISIRWENLTAEHALMAVLNNYNLQLVEDSKTKIARVTAKDPTALPPLVTKAIQLKYAGPSNLVASVSNVLTDKRSKVMPDVRTSQLIITATESELEAVEALMASLDTATKQVLIEAKILETTLNPKTSKGIDWSGTLAKQNISFGNGVVQQATTAFQAPGTPTTVTLPGGRTITTTPGYSSTTTIGGSGGSGSSGSTGGSSGSGGSGSGTATGGLTPNGFSVNTLSGLSPAIGFLNADGLHAALSFLNNSSDTKTISEPRMVTLDNQKATIDVGLMYPIVNVSAGTANTAGGSQISYSNLTVNLDVTPRITANDFVELKVHQGILKLGPKFASTVGGANNEVDSFFTRKLETTVLIPSANTLVMGGLISDESLTANTKVPVLGDLPGLGLLFRKDSKERNRANLIIFITPTIVQDTDFRPAHTDYLKSTGKEELNEGWSAWDSGKPADWSKPAPLKYIKPDVQQPAFDENSAAPKP